jgi:hypothetical protein
LTSGESQIPEQMSLTRLEIESAKMQINELEHKIVDALEYYNNCKAMARALMFILSGYSVIPPPWQGANDVERHFGLIPYRRCIEYIYGQAYSGDATKNYSSFCTWLDCTFWYIAKYKEQIRKYKDERDKLLVYLTFPWPI